ncbi:MAG: nickel pincer cofactor biosynthesis protein LarC [Armatimonadota bacterium]
MRIAYLDLICGVSGDMTLGALLDAGVSLDALREALSGLPVEGWRLHAERVSQGGIAATKASVALTDTAEAPPAHGRSLAQIEQIIGGGDLEPDVREQSLAIFRRIAEAEGRIHDVPASEVHFHELGGIDAIVDIVGAVAGFKLLDVDEVHASPVPLSHGMVECAHGTFPVPAPAVLELVKGLPTRSLDVDGETVTPTGAGIVTTLAKSFGPMSGMRIEEIGYGAGSDDFGSVPNLLRLVVGQAAETAGAHEDQVHLIQANIDDMSPEMYELAVERTFSAGALDAWLTPIHMKKGRPAVQLSALAHQAELAQVAAAIFANTTTFGIRIGHMTRSCLEREWLEVDTEYGRVRVKVGKFEGEPVTYAPEYEDCRELARRSGVPLKDIYAAALRALGRA